MEKGYYTQCCYAAGRPLSFEIDTLDAASLEFCHTKNLIADTLAFLRHLDLEGIAAPSSPFDSVGPWLDDLLLLAIQQAGVVASYGPRLLPPLSIHRHHHLNDEAYLLDLFSYGMPNDCHRILRRIGSPDDLDDPAIVGDGLTLAQRNLILNCFHVLNDTETAHLFIVGYLGADTPQAIEQVFLRQCKQRHKDNPVSDSTLQNLRTRFSSLKEALDYLNSQYTHEGIVKDYIQTFEKDIPRLILGWRAKGKYHENDLLPLYDYFNLRDQVTLLYNPQLYYRQHPDEAPQQNDQSPTTKYQPHEVSSSFRQRHLAFFQAAERVGLIVWKGDHYESQLAAVELDYLLGRHFCGDTPKRLPQGRTLWASDGTRLPRKELRPLFPHYKKLGAQRNEHTRAGSPKNAVPSNPAIVEKIDRLIAQLQKYPPSNIPIPEIIPIFAPSFPNNPETQTIKSQREKFEKS